MAADSGSHHHPVRIDGLSVAAVTLPGADSGEEAVFCEEPHVISKDHWWGREGNRIEQAVGSSLVRLSSLSHHDAFQIQLSQKRRNAVSRPGLWCPGVTSIFD